MVADFDRVDIARLYLTQLCFDSVRMFLDFSKGPRHFARGCENRRGIPLSGQRFIPGCQQCIV